MSYLDGLSDAQLKAEIQARADAATPGPWDFRNPSPWGQGLAGSRAAEVLTTVKIEPTGIPFTARQYGSPFIATDILSVEDAEFIAHARTDIPWLLKALTDAERQRDKARTEVERRPAPDFFQEILRQRKAAETQLVGANRKLEAIRRLPPTPWHKQDVMEIIDGPVPVVLDTREPNE